MPIQLLTKITMVVIAFGCSAQLGIAQSFHTAKVKSPDAGSMFIYPERIPLKAGGMFTAYRGLMFVPLNRSKPDSDVIAVEFYRFPRAKTANPDTPPIFLLNGGPGFKGLEEDLKRVGRFEEQLERFLSMSDLVIVGQRGIGSSKPDTLIEQSTPPPPLDQPYDAAKAERVLQEVLSRERQFWIDEGVDLSGFNVVEAAADVRDVASALGYDKITILGASFGSHWGMTIIRRFPEIVSRAVLNGMEGPDQTWDHPGWVWNVYKRVAAEAEASEALRELIPEGGLVKAIESIVKNTTENPITVTLNEGGSFEKKVLIDGHAIQTAARGVSRGLPGWPADVIRMHHGDFEQVARRALMRSGRRGPQHSTASFWMLDSSSGITAKRRAEFESDPAMEIIGNTFSIYAQGSPVWKADLGDDFRQNFETEVPTVIVHGTWDTSTPYENALELAPNFKNSKFVTVKRGSHGALGEVLAKYPSFANGLADFIVSGDLSELPSELELPAPTWVVPDLADKE